MKKANVMRGLAVATLLASLSPVACGSDSGNKSSSTSNDKNKDSGAPAPSASSNIPAGMVGCGSKVCGMPDGVTGTPCCADAFNSICGYTSALGGACTMDPPPQPKDCPTIQPIGGFIQLRSCCTSKGECGVNGMMFGTGCLNYADAKQYAMMFTPGGGGGGATGGGGAGSLFNFMLTLPDEQSCTPGDGGS